MKKNINISFIVSILLLIVSCSNYNNLKFIESENQIDIKVDDKLFTSYLYSHDLLKPCLHPVISPSGEIVTRHYPFKEVEGEQWDHKHHTGIYFTYGSKGEVNGNSFWNFHDAPPQITHIKTLEIKSKKSKGSISTLSHWISRTHKPILEEKRLMEFDVSNKNEYKIDFTIYLTAIDTTVTFEHTKEGMFAIRVIDWLTEKNSGTLYKATGEYLNAEGNKTEKNIWGKRSKWVRLEGEKDGKKIGVAIFNHPSSINYPTYWHARGYGCFSANPIGFPDPDYGPLTLKPGETSLFKFRMLIYEGARGKQQMDEEFNDFSN